MLNKLKRYMGCHGYHKDSDLLGLIALSPLIKEFVPWTASAIRPSALVIILNDIAINGRKNIVELGGGLSTLYIASYLHSTGGGRLTTIEHDVEWLKLLSTKLGSLGFSDCVNLVHAPLKHSQYGFGKNLWYDADAIEKANLYDVDMLVIDGPPAYMKEASLSRYPALPVLNRVMSKSCSIWLDDGNRKGEKKIAELWEKEFGFKFSDIGGNMLMATRGNAWNVL